MAAIGLKTTFEPLQMKTRVGWYVLVTRPLGPQQQLGGFNSESEARERIARKSAAWLKEHQDLF
jgi:hypothetical protein